MKNRRKALPKNKFPLWGWIIIGVLTIAVIGVLIYKLTKPAEVSLPAEISVTQASQMLNNGAYILDVREPSEWAQFHLSGAFLIPLETLPNRLNEVPRNRQVVVYCRTGVRSAKGRDILLASGFKQVTSMAGGITQWQAQGLPVISGQ